MPTPSNDQERAVGIPGPDELGTWPVQVEPPSTDGITVVQLPAVVTDQQGTWISMHTAFERLDGMAGGPGRLALVMFDSAPAMAMVALGPPLAAVPTNELQYQPQWHLHSTMLDSVDGRDPQATEDQHVKAVKQRSDTP